MKEKGKDPFLPLTLDPLPSITFPAHIYHFFLIILSSNGLPLLEKQQDDNIKISRNLISTILFLMNSANGKKTVDLSARHELMVLQAFFSLWLFSALRLAFVKSFSL